MSAEDRTSRNTDRAVGSIGKSCAARGTEIANYSEQLRQLNQQYPGERKKPLRSRDPEFERKRSELSSAMGRLVVSQREDRTRIKEMLRKS